MILQLKNPNSAFPHNGWPFVDERTGFKCNGWEGTPQMHAPKIIKNRRDNPQHYSTSEGQWFDVNSVVQEIYAQKHKTHPHLFKGFADAIPVATQIQSKPIIAPTVMCSCGSNDFEPEFCKTCGGRRITGYKCKKCGKHLKK